MSDRASPASLGRPGRAARSLLRELSGLGPAALILAALVCVLVPLPTAWVDLLLSVSLAGAVLLVVASVQVRQVTDLLGFPTLVLLLTLVRLALNVSTTRLILAQADAGRVVDAFATLVVRDDLVIGAVMFAVVTAIQYLVIARGAERVAEVAARFALDGLPGRQQAIDADLRAGAINPRDAEAQRAALAEQADLFGRMDGVMRWVKNDAVVGLLITAINFVGGLIIGVARAGLDLGDSVALYGRLAIGDGLMAQIPALLVALAAAILVARIDGRGRGRAGGIGADAWLEPTMLLTPAALLAGLAVVPGMPTLAFAITSGALVTIAHVHARARHRPPPSPAVRLQLGADLVAAAPTSEGLTALRQRAAEQLGIAIPELALDPGFDLGPASGLAADELELRHGPRILGRVRVEPADPAAVLVASYRILLAGAPGFVTLAAVEAAIARQRAATPELVRQATRAVEPVDLLAIIRAFVRERIPAPSVDTLLRALAERRVFGDPGERPRWPEHAREALADCWVLDLCDRVAQHGTPCWLRPTAELEEAVLAVAVADADVGVRVGLSADERARLGARFQRTAAGRPAIIVCSRRARAALAAAIAGSKPRLPVLAVSELLAVDLEPAAVLPVDLDGSPGPI